MKPYFDYWGKSGGSENDSQHKLAYHCLDAAAVAQTLLLQDRLLRTRLASLAELEESDLIRAVSFLCACHDLGKFSASFQGFVFQPRHTRLALELWRFSLFNQIQEQWPQWLPQGWDEFDLQEVLAPWVNASAWHHGLVEETTGTISAQRHFPAENMAAAQAFFQDAAALLVGPEPWLPEGDPFQAEKAFRRSSWLLSGIIVAADWIASNDSFFKHLNRPMELSQYWDLALDQAREAVDLAGLIPGPPSGEMTFSSLFPGLERPTPVQDNAASMELCPGPKLILVEDSTGAGKTEAGLVLACRLLAQGEAESLFMGLSTMATANAMFGRFTELMPRLFAGGEESIVLAHSAKRMNDRFRRITEGPSMTSSSQDGEAAEVQCASWLADNNKKSLLAPVGMGTIDQALAAVLAQKHQNLRLLGLSRSVIIVDEVHAYDAYMDRELEHLIGCQALTGGSMILLSATLPGNFRKRLVSSFQKALGTGDSPLSRDDYPLITLVQKEGLAEISSGHGPGAERTISLDMTAQAEEAMAALIQVAEEGGCACWIRNTVKDAQEACLGLAEAAPQLEVTLFHARLALGDRLALESDLVARFGKHSQAKDRAGRIVVATQVAEQSLDVDFDFMVTDLAPMDLVLQRAGRLHRHYRPDRPRNRAVLMVLSPHLQDRPDKDWYESMFPEGAWVYRRHGQLWLTAKALGERDLISLPGDYRELIEGIYSDPAQDLIPENLRQWEQEAVSKGMAAGSIADLNTIQFDEGYGALGGTWRDETPTRLGQETSRVRLAKWDGVRLRPWHDGSDTFAWRMSELQVNRARVHSEAEPGDSDLAQALEQAKAHMPDTKWVILLPLERDPAGAEAWQGRCLDRQHRPQTVRYSPSLGLEVPPSDA